MCGNAGIITSEPTEAPLRKMLQQQAHRGPDNSGIFVDEGFAGLGHVRLAIIDLTSEANQPFQDNSGRYSLVFNGEIYNYVELKNKLRSTYQFKTTSDTEVLLAAYLHWGKDCLTRLNGMFSFAVWDKVSKSLFAARDRFGVKPFFYSEEKNKFCFASEIKAIQTVLDKKQPNKKVWANYFAFGSYGMPTETFFEGMKKLPAGYFLQFEKGKVNIQEWYDFPTQVKRVPVSKSMEEAKAYYFELLRSSISLRFRADVPIGFNISGGVDSSLLLALVNLYEKNKKIQAYTFYTGHKDYDELPWVEKMIANTNNPLKKVKLESGEVNQLTNFISEVQDEPFGGIPTLAYAKIFEQAGKDGVKVLLDGQGMDEQWAGYDYYTQNNEATIQGQEGSPFKPNILHIDVLQLAEKPPFPRPFDNALQNKQYRDLFYTKIPRALRFNDRISMAYGTELREPFLDHRLVEFAFAQPSAFKIKDGVHKYLLRELLKDLVPAEITYAPKRPLQTPQREWLGGGLKSFVEGHLLNLKNSNVSSWFNQHEIEKEWNSYLAGNNQSSFHVWQWVMASIYL